MRVRAMTGQRYGEGDDGGRPTPPPRGLICPACRLPMVDDEVIQTRNKDGYIYRQRRCSCGRNVSTRERIIGG